jgi:hypothetical protein
MINTKTMFLEIDQSCTRTGLECMPGWDSTHHKNCRPRSEFLPTSVVSGSKAHWDVSVVGIVGVGEEVGAALTTEGKINKKTTNNKKASNHLLAGRNLMIG